jgi:O-methyltransferase
MAGFTTGGRGDLLDRLQFPGGSTIADIGGADGTLLAEILRRLPGRRGIVFDAPSVVAAATAKLAAAGFADRVTAISGDFFDSVPTADIYVLSAVLHDSDDAPHAARIVDLTMPAMLGGRERTESQWRRLLGEGGFALDRITSGSGMYCAIEATPHRR